MKKICFLLLSLIALNLLVSCASTDDSKPQNNYTTIYVSQKKGFYCQFPLPENYDKQIMQKRMILF